MSDTNPEIEAETEFATIGLYPYVIEPFMRVFYREQAFMVARTYKDTVDVYTPDDGDTDLLPADCLVVDLDHAGTCGLLLDQYRKRSGYATAGIVWSHATRSWHVVVPNFENEPDSMGSGPSDGRAIADALTRLAAKGSGDLLVDVLHARFHRIDTAIAAINRRLDDVSDNVQDAIRAEGARLLSKSTVGRAE